jgi:hypothetical protein
MIVESDSRLAECCLERGGTLLREDLQRWPDLLALYETRLTTVCEEFQLEEESCRVQFYSASFTAPFMYTRRATGG